LKHYCFSAEIKHLFWVLGLFASPSGPNWRLTDGACKHTLKFKSRRVSDGFLGKAWLKLKAAQINAEFRSKIRFMPNFPIGKPWQIKLLNKMMSFAPDPKVERFGQ